MKNDRPAIDNDLASEMPIRRTYDRTADISKCHGYTSAGVQHRWDIFEPYLETFRAGDTALDFGCGSLRESFELASAGLDVTAVDNNRDTLESYRGDYHWLRPPRILTNDQVSDGALADSQFRLICAFDVLEHLEHPAALLDTFHQHLADDGMIFCSVPNRLPTSHRA